MRASPSLRVCRAFRPEYGAVYGMAAPGMQGLFAPGYGAGYGVGEPLPTYDNSNIVTFARVWTGFSGGPGRGNVEPCLQWVGVQWRCWLWCDGACVIHSHENALVMPFEPAACGRHEQELQQPQ